MQDKRITVTIGKRLYYLIKSGKAHEIMFKPNAMWIRRLTGLTEKTLLFSYRNGYQTVPFKDFQEVSFSCKSYEDKLRYKIENIRYGYPKEREFIPEDDNNKYFIITIGTKKSHGQEDK